MNTEKPVTKLLPALPPRTSPARQSSVQRHIPPFIRRKEVCHPTGLSPSSVYLLMNQNKFPASHPSPGGKGCCVATFGRSGMATAVRRCTSQPANDA